MNKKIVFLSAIFLFFSSCKEDESTNRGEAEELSEKSFALVYSEDTTVGQLETYLKQVEDALTLESEFNGPEGYETLAEGKIPTSLMGSTSIREDGSASHSFRTASRIQVRANSNIEGESISADTGVNQDTSIGQMGSNERQAVENKLNNNAQKLNDKIKGGRKGIRGGGCPTWAPIPCWSHIVGQWPRPGCCVAKPADYCETWTTHGRICKLFIKWKPRLTIKRCCSGPNGNPPPEENGFCAPPNPGEQMAWPPNWYCHCEDNTC